MSENQTETPRDSGPHQHAHAAPTTQQIRTVGQRRREAEEKLEHHLEEARHKSERHDGQEQEQEQEHEHEHDREQAAGTAPEEGNASRGENEPG